MTIGVVLKTITNESFSLDVEEDMLVQDFKGIVKNSTSVPEERQRLIYRGRVLQDQNPLHEYKIENGHTIHMVAKPADYEELQQRISTQEAYDETRQASSQSALQSLLALSALAGDPLSHAFPSGLLGRRTGPADNGPGAENTSLEPIRQSLLTVHTLLSTMPTLPTPGPSATAPFPWPAGSSRRFFLGQWLDVKDTVNQWLEATIMQVDQRQTRLFIHYNGWPTRWDEWLPFDSPRIAPFRTRTANSTIHQSSPSPNNTVAHAPRTGADDVRAIIPELSRLVNVLQPMLAEAAGLCEENLRVEPLEAPDSPYAVGMPWEAIREGDSTAVTDQRWEEPENPLRNGWQRAGRSRGDGHRETGGCANEPAATEDSKRSAESPPLLDGAFNSQTETAGRLRLEEISGELCPVLDRLGRALTDVSPHLQRFSTRTPTPSPSSGVGLADRNSANSTRVGSTWGPQSGPETSRGRTSWEDSPLQSILHRRAPSPPVASSFRAPVTTPARASGGLGGGGNHLDIHIHAILTPARGPPATAAVGAAVSAATESAARDRTTASEDVLDTNDSDDLDECDDEDANNDDCSDDGSDDQQRTGSFDITERHHPPSQIPPPSRTEVRSPMRSLEGNGPSRFETEYSQIAVSQLVQSSGESSTSNLTARSLSSELERVGAVQRQPEELHRPPPAVPKKAASACTRGRPAAPPLPLGSAGPAAGRSRVRMTGSGQGTSRGDRTPATRGSRSKAPGSSSTAASRSSLADSQSTKVGDQDDSTREVTFLQRVRRSLSFHHSSASSSPVRAAAAPVTSRGSHTERVQQSRPAPGSVRRATAVSSKEKPP